jgi:hypothetical protein
MKKIVVLFLFVSVNYLYAQHYSTDVTVTNLLVGNQDLSFFERFIKDFPGEYGASDWFYHICDLTKIDLRILRNAIYAKYGYIFSAIELKKYFSQFNWYVGTKTNVDSELSEKEWIVIKFLQQMEANYPSDIPEELIGLWRHDIYLEENWWTISPYNTYYHHATNLRFWPNGIFVYLFSDNNVCVEYLGFWSFENTRLKLNFYSIGKGVRKGYDFFDPVKHHRPYTSNFQEEIIFFNKKINQYGEDVWECHFQKNENYSWKKQTGTPQYHAPEK